MESSPTNCRQELGYTQASKRLEPQKLSVKQRLLNTPGQQRQSVAWPSCKLASCIAMALKRTETFAQTGKGVVHFCLLNEPKVYPGLLLTILSSKSSC